VDAGGQVGTPNHRVVDVDVDVAAAAGQVGTPNHRIVDAAVVVVDVVRNLRLLLAVVAVVGHY